ncbi:MAG TPA: hypothetical protein VI282_10195 [Verrucomicrobiae bacterium]|jgi:hypothetical protein
MEDPVQRERRWVWLLMLILLGLVIFYSFAPYIVTGYPPNWLERRDQRQQILQRVTAAGGWTALKQDCEALADKHKDDQYPFSWFRGNTNSLPPSIAMLKPKEVVFYPPRVLRQFDSEGIRFFGSNVVVRISIFGAHATGGHDQPWLGLDVVCESALASYRVKRLRSTTPLRYWRYRKIVGGIYEYY